MLADCAKTILDMYLFKYPSNAPFNGNTNSIRTLSDKKQKAKSFGSMFFANNDNVPNEKAKPANFIINALVNLGTNKINT